MSVRSKLVIVKPASLAIKALSSVNRKPIVQTIFDSNSDI